MNTTLPLPTDRPDTTFDPYSCKVDLTSFLAEVRKITQDEAADLVTQCQDEVDEILGGHAEPFEALMLIEETMLSTLGLESDYISCFCDM